MYTLFWTRYPASTSHHIYGGKKRYGENMIDSTNTTDSDGYTRFEILKPSEFRQALADHLDDRATDTLTKAMRQENNGVPAMVYDAAPTSLLFSLYEKGIIDLILPDDGRKFRGGAEVYIENNKLKYVKPAQEGNILAYNPMFLYSCMFCGDEKISRAGAKPVICTNPGCGRKNSFKANYPTELEKPVWLLGEKPIEAHPMEIYDELLDFYRDHIVLREQEYHTLAAWVMASWLVDDFHTCPYLALIAPMSSGKTQVLEAIRQTAYRAYGLASVTPAAIFRAIEMWRLTLCIDEAEHQIGTNTESGQAIYACLLAGYKRGIGAMRAEKQGEDWMPTSFDLFGFKAFSGTKIVLPTLASRSIEFRMRKARPKYDLFTQSDGLRLRSMLLWFRFTNLHKHKIIYPQSDDGRIRELYSPLFTISRLLDNEAKENLQKMLEESMQTRKADDRQSTEAEIVAAINELAEQTSGTLTGERVFIYVSELLDMLGWDRDRSTSTRLGRSLKAMGLQTRHTKSGKVLDLYDGDNEAQLEYLQERYVS